MSMAKVQLIGRLGKDPVVKTIPSGHVICSFSVATDKRVPKGSAKQPMWTQVSVFNKLADVCMQYLKKGSQVYVEGPFEMREWIDDAGLKQCMVQVTANEVQFLGSAQKNEGAAASTQSQPKSTLTPSQEATFTEDDIPF